MSIFGVWMWPHSVAVSGAEKAAALCADIGISDIYFLTKGLSGIASCRSAFAPQDDDRDLLAELLQTAHARGIRVHAWLTSTSDEHYKHLFPDSGRCHYTRGKDKGLIALTDCGYLSYMEQFVRELCRNYAIDGLHLDYIRYNHLLYGWSKDDQARYAASGADIAHLRRLMDKTFISNQDPNAIFDAYRSGDESVLALAQVRRLDVLRFAQALTACARAERKELILSAALMPEGAYDDLAFSDLHYGQSYQDAAGLYDYVLPMAYSHAYRKDSRWVRSVAEGTLKKGLRAVMGLHAYDGGTAASLHADMHALGQIPVCGVCLFRFGAFAVAIPDGASLRIINPLDQPITSVTSAGGDALLGGALAPGCETRIPLPPTCSLLRAFCGDSEICLYTADQITTKK